MSIFSPDFKNRLDTLDNFVSNIYSKLPPSFIDWIYSEHGHSIKETPPHDKIKFYIICFIHYVLLTLFYSSVLFVDNLYILSIISIVLVVQVLLNIYDGGCFIMKLERKYIGKEWFGPYTLINSLVPGLITSNSLYYIFYTMSFITTTILIYKLYRKLYC
jgi:hypothetical protein